MAESRILLLRLLRSLIAAVNGSEDGEQGARACLRGVCERTRQALRESETRFRTVAEAASDAIVSIDARGRILFWNAAAERSFGYPAPEVVGCTLEVILPERYREDCARELRRVLATRESKPVGRPVEVHGLRRDGTEFPVELSLSSWTAEGQTFFTGILRDVTGRARTEELARLVEERTAEIRREKDFSQRLVESGAQGILAFDRECRYTVWNPAMERLTGMSKERVLGHAAFGLFPFLRETPVFGAYAEALAGRSNTVEETPYTIPQTGRAGFFEARYSPLVGEGGEIVGGLGIVEDVTERKLRELERDAIVAVTSVLRAAATAAEMLPVVLDQVADLLKAECSAVVLRDEDSGELSLELGRGGWASMTGTRELGGESLGAAVIASGRPILDNAVPENPRLAGQGAMAGITATACVPLISQQQTLGALWIGRRAPIQQDELRLLVAIAEMTANALRRSSLHEQTERRLRQITALRAGEMAISSSLDLRLTLKMLLEQITTLLGVDASAVLLLNEHTRTLEYAAGSGFRTSAYVRTRLRVGQGLPGQAVLERQRRFVPDLHRLEGGLQRVWLVAEEGFTSYLAVPLVAKGVVKGVLELLHRSALATTTEWLDLVDTLALQASVAIDNATMFDAVNRSNLELAIAYDTTLEGWSRTLELRDEETEGHTARVTEVTVRLARALGMRDEEVVHLRRGALLHDIGKMAVPDRILLKPGALDEEEWRVMRLHPVYALDVLSPIPFLRPALDIPHYHHERWDGAGYPRGLRGEEIPLAARIFAVVDVWEALRSDRPYRPAWPEERVREHIRREAGTHFDPRMVELFMRETAQDRPEPRAPAPKGLEEIAAFGPPAARH